MNTLMLETTATIAVVAAALSGWAYAVTSMADSLLRPLGA